MMICDCENTPAVSCYFRGVLRVTEGNSQKMKGCTIGKHVELDLEPVADSMARESDACTHKGGEGSSR